MNKNDFFSQAYKNQQELANNDKPKVVKKALFPKIDSSKVL